MVVSAIVGSHGFLSQPHSSQSLGLWVSGKGFGLGLSMFAQWASQYLSCIGELWTKLIYQVWTNENSQGCKAGSRESSAAFPSHCTLRLSSHLLPTGIQVQLKREERKVT